VWPLGDLRRDLAPDHRDRVEVAVQEVLAHHPGQARLAERLQLRDRFVDRALDRRLGQGG